MAKITSIVFDVGNVLFAYYPDRIIERLFGETPYRDHFLEHVFMADAWQQMDRGDLSVAQLVERLNRAIPDQPEFIRGALRIIEEFPDHLEPIDDAIEMFKVLARQYPVYILSNFQDSPFDRLVVRHPFLREARGTVVSAKVNMMKPEPDIYHHLIGHYNLTPQETVFIDDRPENIEAAAMFGINGILFQDPAQVRRELIKLGILL